MVLEPFRISPCKGHPMTALQAPKGSTPNRCSGRCIFSQPYLAVARKHVPGWCLSKWNQQLKPANPSFLILSHMHLKYHLPQASLDPPLEGRAFVRRPASRWCGTSCRSAGAGEQRKSPVCQIAVSRGFHKQCSLSRKVVLRFAPSHARGRFSG